MLTTEQLYEIIKIQQDEINQLRDDIKHFKEQSDLNDYWLREMIDALTESIDNMTDDHCCCEKYQASKNERKERKRLEREMKNTTL